ncbi:MAG: VCBS repeat-containing protein [Planctomycetes bacterium]|nr:VCBS repeat-containing protein [Planctomycetota bacterium]
MFRKCFLVSMVLASTAVASGSQFFIRGDSNADGSVSIVDPVFTLSHLYLSGPVFCLDAMDANDDGWVDVSDPVQQLATLFGGSAPLPPPYPNCGVDPTTDGLDCVDPGACPTGPGSISSGLFEEETIPVAAAFQLRLADLNADGFDDLITGGGSAITVALGQPTGGFAAPVQYPTPGTSEDISLADFDGDGILDAIVPTSVGLSMWLGDGLGGFGPETLLPAPSGNIHRLEFEDLDGDGAIDLAVLDGADETMTILLGSGTGTFTVGTTHPAGDNPGDVVIGDFDGDSFPDLLVASRTGATALVYLGDGTGAFSASLSIAAGPTWHAVVGDLDGDGDDDAVLCHWNQPIVRVLISNGDGTFQPPSAIPAPSITHSALTDFDFDGILDLVLCHYGTHELKTYRGLGNGSFEPPMTTLSPRLLQSCQLADVDGDCILDAVALRADAVSVQRGVAPGIFEEIPAFPPGVSSPTEVAVTDVDGDGFQDAIVAQGFSLSIMRLDDQGVVSQSLFGPLPEGTQAIETGDLNGDGYPDVVVGMAFTGTAVVLNDGLGGWNGPTLYPGHDGVALAVADFDGDGILDLAITDRVDSNVQVRFGNGDGTFGVALDLATSEDGDDLVAGDLEGDGDVDLIVVTWMGPDVFLGDGTGGFTPLGTVATGGFWEEISLGDLNGDGLLDLVASNANPQTIRVFLGLGTGLFGSETTEFLDWVGPSQHVSPVVADIDGDSILDVIQCTGNWGVIRILLGNGDGTLQPPRYVRAGSYLRRMVLSDFEGDGDLDIFVVDSDLDQLIQLENRLVP